MPTIGNTFTKMLAISILKIFKCNKLSKIVVNSSAKPWNATSSPSKITYNSVSTTALKISTIELTSSYNNSAVMPDSNKNRKSVGTIKSY